MLADFQICISVPLIIFSFDSVKTETYGIFNSNKKKFPTFLDFRNLEMKLKILE